MEEDQGGHEFISLEEIPQSASPEIAASPSVTGPSEITEEGDISEEEVEVYDNTSNDGKPDGIDTPKDGGDPATRTILVTPQPGSSGHGDVADDDKDDQQDTSPDEPSPATTPAASDPEKPPLAPSPSPSMLSVSVRSLSPAEEPVQKKKGGSSQPPRFKNDVEPMEYIRPVAGGHNRAISSVHCKAMLIIMSTSIVVVLVVIGMVILQGEDEETNPNMKELEGEFNITNLLYNSTYSDVESTMYQELSDNFIKTMNQTFEISLNFEEFYERSAVSNIGQWKMSADNITRPSIEFTLTIDLSELNDTLPAIHNDSLVTTPPTTSSSPSAPPIIDEIISYVINVTKSNSFGSFTGDMVLSLM